MVSFCFWGQMYLYALIWLSGLLLTILAKFIWSRKTLLPLLPWVISFWPIFLMIEIGSSFVICFAAIYRWKGKKNGKPLQL